MSLSTWRGVVVGKEEEAGRVPRRKEERVTMVTTEHGSCVTYSIQFIEQEQGASLPAPLVRVSFCGMPTLEVLKEVVSTDPPLGRYEVISTHVLRGRGAVPAMMLLKLLASQPHRFATKDWLSTQMQQEMESGALVRLDTIASQLRTLLCGLEHADTSALRLRLVEYLRNGRSSGPGYQLAPYPLIWLDTEALAWNVEQAARMERFGYRQDALPFWQRAYALASRGSYLPDDPYSEWATDTRTEVQGALRQSVHALGRLYLSLHGRTGEEEAIVLLRTYWLRHKADEDALRPLLELLGERECYQEVEQYYRLLCEALDAAERGKQPDDHTRDIYEFLRIKQIQRPPSSHPVPPQEEEHSSSASSPQKTGLVESTGYTLSDDNQLMLVPDDHPDHAGPLLAETRHLIGRQEWLASVIAVIQAEIPKKLLVLHGPIGVGKSSELNRLAHAFVKQNDFPSQVIVLSLPAREPRDPEVSLDLFVSMLLSESRAAPFPADASRQTRINLALTALAQRPEPILILLDNAEDTLTEEDTLAACWEAFLSRVVRGQHQAMLILATKEWPGWPGRDPQLVVEIPVPPLTLEDSVLLLQRLGLESVPHAALETISQRVACIPLCLEWIAKIAHDPLVHDAWEGFEVQEETSTESRLDAVAQRFARLLQHPTLLGEHLASRLTPLLEHIMDRHLSSDARRVLEHLAVVSIPLGKSALHVFCSRPAWLKELRSASLLAAYTNRIQVLPMVASTVRARLSPEQVYALEERMIEALTRWVEDGSIRNDEAGGVIAELAILHITHHHLLDAADLVLYHGWMCLRQGYAQRLAQCVQTVLNTPDWRTTPATESGGLLLYYFLLPHLGLEMSEREQACDHQRIQDYVWAEQITVNPRIEVYLIQVLIFVLINEDHFEQADKLYHACFRRLEALLSTDLELHAMLLSKQALLFGKWSDFVEDQGQPAKAKHLRECTIENYQQCIHFLQGSEKQAGNTSLRRRTLKKKIARFEISLAYHLNRIGRFEEALLASERSIPLQEQGYTDFDLLAYSYREHSQILAALGYFCEALIFDEKARAEIQQCADSGDTWSQKQLCIYQVNQGRLLLRLGHIDEAERLLQDALPNVLSQGKIYRRFAQEALMEIEQMRNSSHSHYLDWRWIERFRTLVAYDAYWWWAYTGPFTHEEQQQWDHLFSDHLDEAHKKQLGVLLAGARDREVEAALVEYRPPRLQYPALNIVEVRRRIAGLLQLDAEIQQEEPNVIVRRLYQGAIEDELCFMHMLEATYERERNRFWELSCQLYTPPTREEMHYVLSQVKRAVVQGLQHADMIDVSTQLIRVMQERWNVSLDDLPGATALQPRYGIDTPHSSTTQKYHVLPAQAVKRFFEAVLQESGFEGWQVALDPFEEGARIDSALKTAYIQDRPMTVETVEDYFAHEFLGHVGRSVAGSSSTVGLLGIQTKNYAPTEEGLAQHYERLLRDRRGEVYDDSGTWFGALAIGLACGVMTPPQAFCDLYAFLQPFVVLHRLLWDLDKDRATSEQIARERARTRCLMTFRGVPDLAPSGICYTHGMIYLRGWFLISRAVAEDESILDRLAIGKVALELLSDIEELGITTPIHPMRKRVNDPHLEAYILSFDEVPDNHTA